MLDSTGRRFIVTREEFMSLRDFIHDKSGIYFADNKMYLVQNRLEKRMAELDMKTVSDYFYLVKYDSSNREFNRLMDLVTTNETSFFRNEPQLLSFSEEVLPLIISEKLKSKVGRQIKIWSAGCSSGEEPYTLAIQVLEKIKAHPGITVEIIANDISEEILAKARLGQYSGMTLRNVKPELLERYFIKSGDMYKVKPEVKALVKFSHMNLNDPRKTAVVSDRDVVFCRNVMIYFSDEVKKQLVRNFYNALRPEGYFYIGHSETLHGVSKAFKLVYFKNALVYQKEDVGSVTLDSKPSTGRQSQTVRSTVSSTGNASDGARRALDLLSRIKPLAKTS